MQNKPNLKIGPMTITNALTNNYNRKDTWYRGKNEPKTNSICPFKTEAVLAFLPQNAIMYVSKG